VAGVRALHVDPRAYPDRRGFDDAVARVLDEHAVELVCLAGYMRVLSEEFVRRYRGRILNVHPALLPAFPGLHAQRQALEHGVKVAGATVHFVDEGVDTGPIVLQAAVPVLEGDTEASLSARILTEEHRLYPEAVRLYAEGRLELHDRRVLVRPPGESSLPNPEAGTG
jgi:phosphoribosylglycinamide formyltransferase-1